MATTFIDPQHPAWQTVGGMLVSYLVLLVLITAVVFVLPFVFFVLV